jgi:LysM repeat protein
MVEDQDEEIQEFMREITDDLGYASKPQRSESHGASGEIGLSKKSLILGVIGIVVLVILITVFFRGGGLSQGDLAPLQAKLDLVERRLTHLQGLESRIAFLENQEAELQQLILDLDKSGRSLAEQVDEISKKLGGVEPGKPTAPARVKATAPRTTTEKPVSAEKERYHSVRRGETLYRIARQYGISVRELCRLNNISPNQAIYPGQKLLVPSKAD